MTALKKYEWETICSQDDLVAWGRGLCSGAR